MLKISSIEKIDILLERYPCLTELRPELLQSLELLRNMYFNGGKLLVCGNGGSAADSLHIVGELMKSFVSKRSIPQELTQALTMRFPEEAPFYLENLEGAVPAVSLVNEVSLISAFGNDKTAELAFAQQVLGLGRKGDVLLAISTSGNSANVLHAARVAQCMGIQVIALTGRSGGKLRALSDVVLAMPSDVTNQIQELHLPVYHALCLALEAELFPQEDETGI